MFRKDNECAIVLFVTCKMPTAFTFEDNTGIDQEKQLDGRRIPLAVKPDQESAAKLTDFAINNLLRPGDIVHVLTVAVDRPVTKAFAGHGPCAYGGLGYNGVPDKQTQQLDKWLHDNVGRKLRDAGTTYKTHIHFKSVDEYGFPVAPRETGAVINRATKQLGVAAVVVGGTPHRVLPAWLNPHTEDFLWNIQLARLGRTLSKLKTPLAQR